MGKIHVYIIIICLLLTYQTGNAQEPGNELGLYLEMASRNNPELKATFNQYMASLEKVPQMGSLTDLQASFGYFIQPMELLGGNQIGNVQVMQMFPWFGTLKASKDEASMMAKAKYEEFNEAKAELFFQVKSVWYQLMKDDREIELVRDNIRFLESLEKLALVKFQSPAGGISSTDIQRNSPINNSEGGTMNNSSDGMNGMSSENTANNMTSENTSSVGMSESMNSPQNGLQDVLRVKMEILEQQNRLASLSDQRRTEEAKFNALLNRDLSAQVEISDSLVTIPLPVNKYAIVDSILSNNPMLSMLESETSSYAFMEQKAKKMSLPMLGLGLNYMVIKEREENTSMMNGKDMIMPMVSVSIPVYRKKYNAMKNEARLMQEAGNQEAIDLKNKLLVQYQQFIQNLDDAERRISLYKQQEELAQRTTDILLTGFTTTGNDYEEVLRMQMKVLDYSFKHIEAIVDYNTTVAMAEKLMNSVKF
jgi:outer membrane protein TolC